MELTIEHIAPYLPYSLLCQTTDRGKVVVSELNAAYSDNSYTFMNIVESEKGFDEIKPILRPLSDLTNTIFIGEENFMPLNRLLSENNFDTEVMIMEDKLEYRAINIFKFC